MTKDTLGHILLLLAIVWSTPLSAQTNADYPEVPTTTNQNPNGTTKFSGVLNGSIYAATENDPRCADLLFPHGSICGRICSNLPPGRTFSELVSQETGSYARFAEMENYSGKTPQRVCFRIKNWAMGEWRLFTVVVRHKAQ